jgi:hypothetical protein
MNPLTYLIQEGFAILCYWYEHDDSNEDLPEEDREVRIMTELSHLKTAGISESSSESITINGKTYEISWDFITKYGIRTSGAAHAGIMKDTWKRETAKIINEFEKNIASAIVTKGVVEL